MTPLLQRSLWLALAVALAACGGGDESKPNVDVDGGTVVSADGKATLVVPAGAAAAPARVTLAAASTAGLPADASIVAGTAVAIRGDGGPLAMEATLTFDVGRIFPVAAAGDGRRSALRDWPTANPDPIPCSTLYHPAPSLCINSPQLVDLSDFTLAPIGRCLPTPTQAICSINDLTARSVGVVFDPEAPVVTIVATDLPAQPAAVTSAGARTIRVTATDNKGVVKVTFYRVPLHGPSVTEQVVAVAVGSSRVDLQACKLEYSIVSPK